jgi:hypothetical protein
MSARRPTVPLPRYPKELMRPYAVNKSGADPKKLIKQLLEYYSDHKVPDDAPILPGDQIVRLVWGLMGDFVPAFRTSKYRGKEAPKIWYVGGEVGDLYDANQLASLLKKHRKDFAAQKCLFQYVATVHRKRLPTTFQNCRTGPSLKAAFFKVLASHGNRYNKQLRDDPNDDALFRKVEELGKLFERMKVFLK